jgi:hypothetical protein
MAKIYGTDIGPSCPIFATPQRPELSYMAGRCEGTIYSYRAARSVAPGLDHVTARCVSCGTVSTFAAPEGTDSAEAFRKLHFAGGC